MSPCFILFGLCCILAVNGISPEGLKKLKLQSAKLRLPQNESQSRMQVHWELDESKEKANGNSAKEDEEGCFPQLGCFDLDAPWNSDTRPLGSPEDPKKIKTTIGFFSRQNIPYPVHIPIYPEITMAGVNFVWNRRTVVVVHGFESLEKDTWMEDMKDVYLKHVDANIVVVDWGKRNFNFNYLQVASSTRVVGRQLALFVEHLITHYQADPKRFHLIGHGLGAHICSYLAKEVPGIGRLTALDPAQPYFEGFPKEVRIDKTDAKFVEIIHTDAKPFIPNFGFGMIGPHGHVDFYVNGGYEQPGCHAPKEMKFFIKTLKDMSKYTFSTLSEWFHCSHARAYQYFIEAVNHTGECIFWGQKAKEKNIFQSRTNLEKEGFAEKLIPIPTACNEDNCIKMGLHTHRTALRGIFLVTTTSKEPYCVIEEQSEGFFYGLLHTVASIPHSIGHIIGLV